VFRSVVHLQGGNKLLRFTWTETRVGEYNDTNKTTKVVYVCAFIGKLNSECKMHGESNIKFTVEL
jgi:hypothetical protein